MTFHVWVLFNPIKTLLEHPILYSKLTVEPLVEVLAHLVFHPPSLEDSYYLILELRPQLYSIELAVWTFISYSRSLSSIGEEPNRLSWFRVVPLTKLLK